jgi:hypothetical protein
MNREMEIERQPSKMMGVLGEAIEPLVTIHPSGVLGSPIEQAAAVNST